MDELEQWSMDLTKPGAWIDGDYRYALWRPLIQIRRAGNSLGKTFDLFRDILPQAPKVALWVMLNPSTADQVKPDATIHRVTNFSTTWGCTAFIVVNLFAIRSKDPAVLHTPGIDKVGPRNDEAIGLIARLATIDRVIVAWGAWGHLFPARVAEVVGLLDRPLTALGVTKQGQPLHPLYLPGDLLPTPWATSGAGRSDSARGARTRT